MKNYYEIEVNSLQNGYKLIAYYRVYNKDAYDDYSSRNDQYVFLTWAEVVKFMTDNALVVPPVFPEAPSTTPTVAS